MRALRLVLAGAAIAAAVAVPATPASAQMCRIVIDPFWVHVPGTDIWVSVPRPYCVSP